MSTLLRPHVDRELAAGEDFRRRGDLASAWRSLERAHILSQPGAWLHTRVHVAMFVLALHSGDLREVFGQVVRLAVAALGSATGRYPAGNTGRARVPIGEPMPMPEDIALVLEELGVVVDRVTASKTNPP